MKLLLRWLPHARLLPPFYDARRVQHSRTRRAEQHLLPLVQWHGAVWGGNKGDFWCAGKNRQGRARTIKKLTRRSQILYIVSADMCVLLLLKTS
jgi:hypothetical protein